MEPAGFPEHRPHLLRDALVQPGLRAREAVGWTRDEKPALLQGFLDYLFAGNDRVEDSKTHEFLCVHQATGQDNLARPEIADTPLQKPRAGHRSEAPLDFRLPHPYAGMPDPAVAKEGHLKASPGGNAVDRGNQWLAKLQDPTREGFELLHPGRGFIPFRRLVEVLAGAERISGAGHDRTSGPRVLFDFRENAADFATHRAGERVKSSGTLDRDNGDIPLHTQRSVAQVRTP